MLSIKIYNIYNVCTYYVYVSCHTHIEKIKTYSYMIVHIVGNIGCGKTSILKKLSLLSNVLQYLHLPITGCTNLLGAESLRFFLIFLQLRPLNLSHS